MKNYLITTLLLLLLLPFAACNQTTSMEKQNLFPYRMALTAPHDYPAGVHLGYLADGEDFISAIPKVGLENQGWGVGGANAGMGASHIPSFMELTWLSYAEKKFWKVEADLPKEKILALFREGYMALGIHPEDPLVHKTYSNFIIGVAPGGVVVVWLDAGVRQVEIGRYQAKETFVDMNDFYRNPRELSQQGAFDEMYTLVPDKSQKKINQEGFPFGLWDKYRKKYLWRFRTVFYKPDEDVRQYATYLNGEAAIFYKEELQKKQPTLQPVPNDARLIFSTKNAEVFFDEKETMVAFEELTKDNPEEPLEIVGKVGFMYKDMTFTIKSKNKEIPLKKATVKLYNN